MQTSTERLRGRKMFVWGESVGRPALAGVAVARDWKNDGYCEIQAGLARTQLEHLKLPGATTWHWLEAYGRLVCGSGDGACRGLERSPHRGGAHLGAVCSVQQNWPAREGLADGRGCGAGRAVGDRFRLGSAGVTAYRLEGLLRYAVRRGDHDRTGTRVVAGARRATACDRSTRSRRTGRWSAGRELLEAVEDENWLSLVSPRCRALVRRTTRTARSRRGEKSEEPSRTPGPIATSRSSPARRPTEQASLQWG